MDFIRNFKFPNITKKFQLLYLLLLIDIIFNSLFFNIMNYSKYPLPLPGNIYVNSFMLVILKGIIPGVLLYTLHNRIKDATLNQLKKSNILIIGTIILSLFMIIFNTYYLITIL